jgi:uncharacterized damage-inducible protein DinB
MNTAMNNFALMARFNGWANGRLYGVVAALPDEEYRRDRKAFFGSIHNTLNHLLVGDRIWGARLAGRQHGIRSLDQILYDDFPSLRQARKEEDQRLVALVDGFSDEDLRAPVTYRRILGEGEHTTRRDHILLTLFNHQTHHRGQVHAMLTQAGCEVPPLDVIYYLEEIGLG